MGTSVVWYTTFIDGSVALMALAIWLMNVELFDVFAPTRAILVEPSIFRTRTSRFVNVAAGFGGWLLRHPNIFGYLPNDARPRCQPVTGTPFWFRYFALASAARLFSMIPNTLFCSTSCCATVTFRAGSPASSATVRLILRFPSSPLEFATSKRARMPSSDAANDCASGPVWGRIAPTLIWVSLT